MGTVMRNTLCLSLYQLNIQIVRCTVTLLLLLASPALQLVNSRSLQMDYALHRHVRRSFESDIMLSGSPVSTGNHEACRFDIDLDSEVQGVCTFYGACRVKRADYMLQETCGSAHRSNIGGKSNVCKLKLKSKKTLVGRCWSGDCIAGDRTKLQHPDCPAPRSFGSLRI